MRCPRCGFDNPEGLKLCGECGTPLAAPCPRCGFANPPGFKFCGDCGAALGPVSRTSSPPTLAAQPQPPSRYTPAYLAEKILTSKSALEGERKQVTVLFADLKGSMELLADRDPEEARQFLDPVLERMMAAVHRYEGTVNQVMGDGIMALFGAPIAHEDHAVRACYAALAMQASVKQYAAEVQRTKGVPIQIRVGLNAGEVVVRSIGSDLHMDYTAVGQTTHLAGRMEQMAMPGSIVITPDVLALVEGYVLVKALGPAKIKGLNTPLEVYEVIAAGAVHTRLQAAEARGLTRFIGRESELDQLRHALELAGAGHGQVVAIIGEPGMGKSRLVYEFTRSHLMHGWLCLQSRSLSYGRASPYLPIHDLLKAYFQIDDRDDGRKVREKVTGKLLTLDRALEPSLPACLALLDALDEDVQWQALDPLQRRQRTLEAVKRLLLRESQAQPLLLVFEDLHWIDPETEAVLDSLIERLPSSRVLLLISYRPEYQHAWGSKTYYRQLRLDPLSPVGAEELLQALLGDDASLAPLKQLLIERTGGNPFFLEESVQALFDQEILAHPARGAREQPPLLVKPVTKLKLPATVQAVLAARIDRLPQEEKRLVQTAAVIGTEVPLALLQVIAECREEPLRLGLAHLQAAEFLYETHLFPDLAYTFKHALTHEVAYGSLLQERRRTLHSQIVEAIEKLYPNRLGEQVERLAHHAFWGEVWDKALAYFRQSGAKAAGRSAYREAAASFEQALVALQHLPESRNTGEQAIDLRIELRNALWPLAEHGRSLEYLCDAENVAKAIDDQRRLGRVSAYLAEDFWRAGNPDRAVEAGQRALAIAEALGDFGLEVLTNRHLGQAYHTLGGYPQAMDFLMRNVASLKGELLRERFGSPNLPSVISRTYLVWSLAERGQFAEGVVRGEEAVRIAEAADYPISLIAACCGVGILYLRKGDLLQAIPVLERGLGLCRIWNILTWFPRTAWALGYAYALSGQVAEALPLLKQAVEQATSARRIAEQSLRVACLGETYLLADRIEEAIQLGQRALELSREHQERGHEAWVLRLLGEIAAQGNPPESAQAEDHYRQALALAEELGMRPLQAHCHLGLGTLYAKIGRRDQAHPQLSTAIELYRAMDMTFWLPQAEAALAQVEKP